MAINKAVGVRAQTTIELMMLLVVSLVALSIIYSLYSGQITSNALSKESTTASDTIRRMVNAADSVYISGAGSSTRVFIELPDSIDMSLSEITGSTIVLRLSTGTDLIGSADVNFSGDWKTISGSYITGGYYATLFYDGNVVNIFYDEFDLSTQSISFSAQQGSLVEKYFNVRNNSGNTATFYISPNFSHSPYAILSIDSANTYFSLAPGETRRVDFNVSLSESSVGNYSGNITVIGQLSDGVTDTNITKVVVVSAESLLELQEVMIYPKSVSSTALSGTTVTKSFSLCNSSSADISGISWEKDSNADANMLSWVSWEPKTSDGEVITSVSKTDCNNFDLNISVPAATPSGLYDSNITVITPYTNFTAFIYITVLNWKELFFTTQNDFNSNTNFLTSYFSAASLANREVPSGELDWNKSADYEFESADYNRDMNGLVGYWKFNDKNSGGWVLNSATGVRDGNLWYGADTNAQGLWDTNAGYFDGVNDVIYAGDMDRIDGATELTVSAWIKVNSVARDNDVFAKALHNTNVPVLFWRDDVVGGGSQIGNTDCMSVLVYDGDTMAWTSSPNGSLNDLGWHHVLFTFKANIAAGLKIYVDGVNVNNASTVNVNSIQASTNVVTIGSPTGGTSTNIMSGSIDEVKVWNRVLSASEVAADFNSFLNSKQVSSVKDTNSSTTVFSTAKVNSDTNYNFGSELSSTEKFFDANLVGLWHLNDKNAQGWVLNSATGLRDGNLKGSADVNAVGLWDTNAGWFNGSSNYIALNNYSNPRAITLSSWVKFSGTTGTSQAIISYGATMLRMDTTLATLTFFNNVATGSQSVTYPLNLNQWYNIVGTYNYDYNATNGQGFIYINGNLVSTAISGNTPTGFVYKTIGKYEPGTSYFNGSIEEVAVWNRALTDAEVGELYKKGASRLDLNVYSCSDANCNNVVGTKQFTKVSNNSSLDISTLASARYLKYYAGFGFDRNLIDRNSTGAAAAVGFPFVSDINVSFYN